MRGTTVKKLNKFVEMIIADTPPAELTKSVEETHKALLNSVKREWHKNGPVGKKFVNKVVNGEFDAISK